MAANLKIEKLQYLHNCLANFDQSFAQWCTHLASRP